MKNKAVVFLILFLCGTIWVLPKENSWGNLKKIYFYDSLSKYDQVLEHLSLLDFEGLKRDHQQEIATRLIAFGDSYFKKGKYRHAEEFYKKVLKLSPDYWYLYNKLEKIDRVKGRFFINFNHLFSQLFMMLKSFKASFLLVNQFFNLLFFAALLVFFLFSLILLSRYFKLAGNDLVIDGKGEVSIKKVLIFFAIILWPIVLLTGWMVYPFIITGFFWAYLSRNEKKAVKTMLILVAAAAALYCLNLVLEKNIRTDSFKKVQKVYEGHLFAKEDYQAFDDRLKVAQAFSYYEKGDIDSLNRAMDILASTDEDFKVPSKYDLMGNINFRFGELTQSIDYYRESLLLNDKNKIALNNFALALLKENEPDVFKSYAQRYPEIDGYLNKTLKIKDIKINQGELWERLFNFSGQNFNMGKFLIGILGELFKLPVLYYILFFILYVMILPKFVPGRGESSYCSKCSKIIKEGSSHRAHKLCNECHQLFSIKDVIFLEAKILKEKELKRKSGKKYISRLIFSLFIPGLNFHHRENNRLYLVFSLGFYFLLGVAVVGTVNFNRFYLASPLALNFIGAAAAVLYLLINLFSVIGEEDGI
jgi:tetratricopeptide (TPR) repeat protein